MEVFSHVDATQHLIVKKGKGKLAVKINFNKVNKPPVVKLFPYVVVSPAQKEDNFGRKTKYTLDTLVLSGKKFHTFEFIR